MAKRRVKKRTHVGAKGTQAAVGDAPSKPGARAPKSMVIRIGASEVGPSVSQLVKDVRSMMEPNTASRLKERRTNKLRDYTTMAGPLGVSHLMLFSRSENGNTNMRLAITPRGPTLHFRVDKYSLCKDVLKSMKRPKSDSAGYLTSPLLVMNNFIQATTEATEDESKSTNPIPKQLESLTTTIFQSLFAPISPQQTSLNSIKRVMLVDRVPSKDDEHQFVLQLRHYAIKSSTPKHSLPKALRRLENAEKLTRASKGLPNLGKFDDVADYILDPTAAAGFTSASESEADTDAEVEVLAPENRKVMNKEERQRMRDAQRERIAAQTAAENGQEPAAAPPKRAPRTEKKAIKMQELGPRMTLRLTKVEEGLCGGKIMWHEYISKSKSETQKQEQTWAVRRKEKEERKRVQKENVERKKEQKKSTRGAKHREAAEEGDEDEDEDMEDAWSSDDDDDEWHGEHDGEGGDKYAPPVVDDEDEEGEDEE
ncbi:hypothetical protein AAFC00_001554 [Neodothiora populina]|uniref:Brix domain-containing protein n=1 Tax=Neodothiora populina TaxID=2781224 RepID=A0ABR3PPA7_9PEZI